MLHAAVALEGQLVAFFEIRPRLLKHPKLCPVQVRTVETGYRPPVPRWSYNTMSREAFHGDPAQPISSAAAAPGPPPGTTRGSGATDGPVAGSTVTGNSTVAADGSLA